MGGQIEHYAHVIYPAREWPNAPGMNPEHPAKLAHLEPSFQLYHRRVEPLDMPHSELYPFLASQAHHLHARRDVVRYRLLHQKVYPRPYHIFRNLGMEAGRDSYRRQIQSLFLQHLPVIPIWSCLVRVGDPEKRFFVHISHRRQVDPRQFGIDTGVVLPHGTNAYNTSFYHSASTTSTILSRSS